MLKIILSIGAIQIIALAIQFIRSKVIAVLLGPEGVGVVSTIDQFVQFAAYVVVFSIPQASLKFLSRAHSEGHEAFKRSYVGFLKIVVFLSVAATFIIVGLILLRPQTFDLKIENYQLYLLIAIISLPSIVLSGYFSNVFAGAQNYLASAGMVVINNSLTTIFMIVGITTAGVFGLLVGGSIANIILTFGILIFLWKKLNLPFFDPNTKILSELKQTPDIIPFTAMLYFGSVSYSLSQFVVRYAILSNYGEAETGLLQGALVLSLVIGMVSSPANGLYLTPIMNRNIEKEVKIRHAIEYQRKMILVLILISLPVVMFPQTILTIMFSTKFTSVGNLIFLFIIAQFITPLAGIHQAVLIGTNHHKTYTLITTLGNIGYTILIWFIVPGYGIRGVAFSGIILSLIIFFTSLISLKLQCNYSIPRSLGWLLAYSFLSLAAAGWLCSGINELDISIVIAKIIFFVLFAVSLLLFLNTEERTRLYQLRHKILLSN